MLPAVTQVKRKLLRWNSHFSQACQLTWLGSCSSMEPITMGINYRIPASGVSTCTCRYCWIPWLNKHRLTLCPSYSHADLRNNGDIRCYAWALILPAGYLHVHLHVHAEFLIDSLFVLHIHKQVFVISLSCVHFGWPCPNWNHVILIEPEYMKKHHMHT